MSSKRLSTHKMVAKGKRTVISCSTPEHQVDSPSRDSDSICNSEASSPIPFLCTQDGAEGETDVVWNFYTPKSETVRSRTKNTTPVSRRVKKAIKSNLPERPLPKRKAVRSSQKTELFQELLELNRNVHEFLVNNPIKNTEAAKPQSEEDMFSDASDSSPRTRIKSMNRCLRKNVLSSKFAKTESESGLESDDSMNECLLKVSQVVEENILNLDPKPPKRMCSDSFNTKIIKRGLNVNMDQESMDVILSNFKIESPSVGRTKKCDSTRLNNNDSFDTLLGNLNDSALEKLSQMPVTNPYSSKKISNSKESNWTLKELIVCEGSPSSKSIFGRHSSMPESPSVTESNKPSTSGMVFGRYNSLPFNKSNENITVPGDSPIRCTPDEIKKKHQQAREKLLAKRLLPFTATHQSNPLSLPAENQQVPKKAIFQPKVPSSKVNNAIERKDKIVKNSDSDVHLKSLIEKKRQEALLKLRKRQTQTK